MGGEAVNVSEDDRSVEVLYGGWMLSVLDEFASDEMLGALLNSGRPARVSREAVFQSARAARHLEKIATGGTMAPPPVPRVSCWRFHASDGWHVQMAWEIATIPPKVA